jgi:ankyrin repeat protein
MPLIAVNLSTPLPFDFEALAKYFPEFSHDCFYSDEKELTERLSDKGSFHRCTFLELVGGRAIASQFTPDELGVLLSRLPAHLRKPLTDALAGTKLQLPSTPHFHRLLIELRKKLGYEPSDDGICALIAEVLVDYFLIKRDPTALLEYMETHRHQLPAQLQQLRDEGKPGYQNQRLFSSDEKEIINEAAAFFSMGELYMFPHNHAKTFGKYLTQLQTESISPYAAPALLKSQGGRVCLASFCGIYNHHKELPTYVALFSEFAEKHRCRLILSLSSSNHRIVLCFSGAECSVIDANNLDWLSSPLNDCTAIADKIVTAFLHTNSQHSAFATSIITTGDNAASIEPYVAQLLRNEEFMALHEITEERANLDLAHLAISNNDLEALKKLITLKKKFILLEEGYNTLLHAAAAKGSMALTSFLITQGANVTHPDEKSYGYTPIHLAAGKGHTDVVELLAFHGADITQTAPKGVLPIHSAAQNGYTGTVEWLATHGASVTQTTSAGSSAIHLAAQNGHTDTVKYLVGRDNSVITQTNPQGYLPIHLAAQKGYTDTVKWLTSHHSASVTQENQQNGFSPIHYAAHGGHPDTIEYLVNHGADIKAVDTDGFTPLHLAAERGHLETVKLLITLGVDIKVRSTQGLTCLHLAAQQGHLEIVEFLLTQQHIDLTEVDEKGHSVIHHAAQNGHTKVIELLTANGADINTASKDGSTPLHFAVRQGHANTVEYFVTHNAEINRADNKGCTSVHYAVDKNNDILVTLITYGADPNKVTKNNLAPLHVAALSQDTEAFKYLVANGANVNIAFSNNGYTPLHFAALKGNIQAIDKLVIHGATIDAANNDNKTPLHFAAQHEHTDTVKLLLLYKAKIDVRDNDGRIPLHYAAMQGNTEVISELITHDTQTIDAVVIHGDTIDAADNDNKTPLHLAAQHGYTDAVKLLLLYNAKIDVRDNDGRIPLHYAAMQGNTEVISELITHDTQTIDAVVIHGDTIDAADNDNKTPLHLAAQHGHTDASSYYFFITPKSMSETMMGVFPCITPPYRAIQK